MALVTNFHKLGDARIVRLLDDIHQEFLNATHQASETEGGLVGVAPNGNFSAHLFRHQPDGLEQSGNAPIRIGVDTDLNHHSGNSTVEQGAEIIVALATLAVDAPTGTFQAAAGTRPW